MMGIFDRFKKNSASKQVSDEAPSGSHGSHFEAALGNLNLVKGLVMMAASEPDRKEDLKVETPAFGKALAHVGIKGVNAALLELWIYALGNVVKGNFKKGDYISGVLWLQGSIA